MIPPQDKLLHYIVGVLIYLVANIFLTPIQAIGIVAIIAVGKEVLYDKMLGKGTPEMEDIIYTMLGGLTTLMLITIKDYV